LNLCAYVAGIGVLGPGLTGWPQTSAVLSGREVYKSAATVLPMPTILAAAERRRTGRVVKLALAVGLEAVAHAGANPAELASVFSSSGGDGDNCHELCQALTLDGREISPTRFANSVHNIAAGYWSIGTGAMTKSNVLCAFDASFGAGLLEAMTQVAVDQEALLLVSYDTAYPLPLHTVRPIPDAFGIAMVLTPDRCANSLAQMQVSLTAEPLQTLADPALERLRREIPAARSLPLLRLLAAGSPGRAIIEYLDVSRAAVQVESCS
jgi:hypothetical protein